MAFLLAFFFCGSCSGSFPCDSSCFGLLTLAWWVPAIPHLRKGPFGKRRGLCFVKETERLGDVFLFYFCFGAVIFIAVVVSVVSTRNFLEGICSKASYFST